jgi:hypothetical protein
MLNLMKNEKVMKNSGYKRGIESWENSMSREMESACRSRIGYKNSCPQELAKSSLFGHMNRCRWILHGKS